MGGPGCVVGEQVVEQVLESADRDTARWGRVGLRNLVAAQRVAVVGREGRVATQTDPRRRRSIGRALPEYVEFHYGSARNHQGIGNRIIEPGPEVGVRGRKIVRVDRLGGLLRYYRRVAA